MLHRTALALIAVLIVSACGGTDYLPVNTIDQSRVLYVALNTPDGAAPGESPAYNTSCENPANSVDDSNVAEFLEDAIGFAIDQEFGVVHLCEGTYETTSLVEFENVGSITIRGDGPGATVIEGAGDHPLLLMAPSCLEEAECPSQMNTLTLQDIALTNGFSTSISAGEIGDWILGGAVTAPMIRTIRASFTQNEWVCGGAVALYGSMLRLLTDNTIFEDGLSEEPTEAELLEYLSRWDTSERSTFHETTFEGNSAAIGGAIAGTALLDGDDLDVEGSFGTSIIACLNPGPIDIVDSDFTGNFASSVDADLPIGLGGGAIVTFDVRFVLILEGGGGYLESWLDTEESRDPWLRITRSEFNENTANGPGGAVIAVGATEIRSSTFTANRAIGTGSAGGAITSAGSMQIFSSNFSANDASSGGALALGGLFGGADSLYLYRTVFNKNVAVVRGGAIEGWYREGIARGNRFTSNRAPLGSAVAVAVPECTRMITRRMARDWKGNTFRMNRGGRLPVECYVVDPEPT